MGGDGGGSEAARESVPLAGASPEAERGGGGGSAEGGGVVRLPLMLFDAPLTVHHVESQLAHSSTQKRWLAT